MARMLEADAAGEDAHQQNQASAPDRVDYYRARIEALEREISANSQQRNGTALPAQDRVEERLRVDSLATEQRTHQFGRSFGAPPAGRNLQFQGMGMQNPQGGRLTMRDLKLSIKPFDGTETYPGLGTGFEEWGWKFLRELELAQQLCGLKWTEDLKIDKSQGPMRLIPECYEA